MAHCHTCGAALERDEHYRRSVFTGRSSGSWWSRRGGGGSSRASYGIRTVCGRCAKSIDRWAMFKVAFVVALIAIFYLATRDPKTSTAESPHGAVEVATAVLRVRADPSTSAKVLTTRPRGAQLTVLEERNGWLRVSDGKLSGGWVGKGGVETRGGQGAP